MPLRVVMETKELLEEAQEWGMFTWASERNKSRIRTGIEAATDALEREVEKAKKSWSRAVQKAYRELDANGSAGARVDPGIQHSLQNLKDLEYAMRQATNQFQLTFDEAEKELDAGKARHGALQARRVIEMHELVLKLSRAEGSAPSPAQPAASGVHRSV